MIRSRVALLAMLAQAPTLASCGRGDGPVLYPVRGQVMYKGQPAAGATVILRPEDAPTPGATPLVPTGQVDAEGNFSLATGDFGDGAPPGKYRVLIQWRTKAEGDAEPQAVSKKKSGRKIVPDKPDGTPDRLQGRHMKPESARLVEVKPENNTFPPFDVSN